MNPFQDATETSLSKLPAKDWIALRSHWLMFNEYAFCRKLGSKWSVEGFGLTGPLFPTKFAAGEYASNLLRAEDRHRAKLAWRESTENKK